MKKLFLTLSLAFACTVMFAVPAKRGQWKTVKLANGQEVRVELRGDEFCKFWQTADGLKLVENPKTGFYEKADMKRMTAKAAELRAKAHAPKLNRPATRGVDLGGDHPVYEGEKKVLLILVQFADVKFKPEHTADLYRRITNEEGFSEGKFRGSVRDYYHDQSFGKFALNFDIAGPVTLPEGYAYYGAHTADGANDSNLGEFTRQACQLADDQVDYSQYDWDGDGEVEMVFFLYAGHGEASYDDPNTIWPHKSNIRYQAPYTPLTLDGTRIDTYACSNELGSGDEIDGIGAICHEFSHCLGLADMYDTSYNGNFGLSKWGIMDQGNYNGDSFIPANYTSYERWYLGWIEPTELTGTMQVNNMKSLGESGESYIIYNEGNKDEYYMLENRTLTGWDSALPGSGLLVLHIDFDPTIWANNLVNSMPDKQYCTIFHADNSATTSASDLAGDTYPYAYNNSLTNTSKPAATLNNVNSDGSYNMNKAVTGITKNADGTISFAFEDQTSSPEDYNLPASYVFYESFDQCNGQGGNDGRFSGSSLGKGTFTTDNGDWSHVGGHGANQCAMVGSTTLPGQVTTPEISIDGETKLWFKVAPYTGDGTQLTLDVKEGDAELSQTEFTMIQGRWSAFSTKITGTGNVKIRFKTNKGRFFIDKVCLTTEDVTGINSITVDGNAGADGRIYSLDGRYMGKDFNSLQKGVYIVNGKKIIK